jgi:hypothetical protein
MTKVKLVQKYTTDPQITIPNNPVKFISQGKEELLTDSDVKPMMIKKNNDVLFCSIILVSKSTISDSSGLQIWANFNGTFSNFNGTFSNFNGIFSNWFCLAKS